MRKKDFIELIENKRLPRYYTTGWQGQYKIYRSSALKPPCVMVYYNDKFVAVYDFERMYILSNAMQNHIKQLEILHKNCNNRTYKPIYIIRRADRKYSPTEPPFTKEAYDREVHLDFPVLTFAYLKPLLTKNS